MNLKDKEIATNDDNCMKESMIWCPQRQFHSLFPTVNIFWTYFRKDYGAIASNIKRAIGRVDRRTYRVRESPLFAVLEWLPAAVVIETVRGTNVFETVLLITRDVVLTLTFEVLASAVMVTVLLVAQLVVDDVIVSAAPVRLTTSIAIASVTFIDRIQSRKRVIRVWSDG